MATRRRLFVGGLFPEVSEDDLKTRFAKFGEVKDVDIHVKNDDCGDAPRVFAYVELIANDADLAKCFKVYSNIKWKGCEITLQIAKENFLQRLKKEQETQESKHGSDAQKHSLPKHADTLQLSVNLEQQQKQARSPMKKTLPKFQGTKSSFLAEEHSETSKLSVKPFDLITQKRHFSQENASKLHPMQQSSDKEQGSDGVTNFANTFKDGQVNSLTDNEKRLQALKEKKTVMRMQRLAIRNALSGKNIAKKPTKIVFESAEDEVDMHSSKFEKSSNTMKLFSESEGEGSDCDQEESIDVKSQFQGKKGYKLMELQSRYKGDERFRLDERFLEPSNEDEEESIVKKQQDPSVKVLENMFGSLEPSKKKLQDQVTFRPVPRFDPTQKGAEKYIVKRDASSAEQKKKKRKIEREVEPLPKVSEVRYYEVSTSLKDSLVTGEVKKDTGFSLLKEFGENGDDVVEDEDHNASNSQGYQASKATSVHRVNPFEKNPFMFESSDEDEEDQSKNTIEFMKPFAKNRQSGNPTFFFQPNDERFKDAFEFYRKEPLEEIERKWQEQKRLISGVLKRKIKKVAYSRNKTLKRGGHIRKGFHRLVS